uniref:Glutathione peroxidase n=1 Tax=Mastacembelus armatus TaxID=205130 RepID=A0A7N8X098_9TELE
MVNVYNVLPFIHSLGKTQSVTSMSDKSIYNFSAETLDGQLVPLSDYKGKALLIVNVATF